jgi:hypothetical protein
MERGFIEIASLTCDDESLRYRVDETVMTVFVPRPIDTADSITFLVNYYLKIPTTFDRIGYAGDHYEMVQWYPKLCVFDEEGWHREPYHVLGEFYGEFGTYDVTIDVPGTFVVAATGERVAEQDKEFLDSLVISNKRMYVGERKTVKFYAEHVHDFAWVCDPDYIVKKYSVDSSDVYIFYVRQHEKSWQHAGQYAVDALERYNQWYGHYPYTSVSVVDGYYRDGMEYPGLVIIGIDEDPFTRFFELVIAHELAHQWFYGIVGSNEIDEAWLDEGFATYSEIRYLEDKYGREHSLIKLPFIPRLSRRYYHKASYYITQTNKLEKPILTPAHEFIDVPFAYMGVVYSKSALFLFNLEGLIGREKFSRILRRYVEAYTYKHSKTEDFIRICNQESERDLQPLFSDVLGSTDYCDWAIKRVMHNVVEIENRGTLSIPVDVFVEAEAGAHVYSIDGGEATYRFVLPDLSGTIKKVIIDPYDYTLDVDRWNNYYPRKIEIKPILDLPSFDAYRIYYVPYLWYGAYDGVTVGLYLFGAEFVDFDFVKGRHQWTFGTIYGLKSKKLYPGFMYQTPIIFRRGMRMRVHMRGSNSNDEDKLGAGVTYCFGIPFSRGPQAELKSSLSYYRLNSYNSVDSVDWDIGQNIVVENRVTYTHADWHINLGLSFSHDILGSDWSYIKMTAEVQKDVETLIPFTMRLFAGSIVGSAPAQEQLFLSGALRINILADLLFAQKGYLSPQEHIHIPGDGNMRGYQTLHKKSDRLVCINVEFPSRSLLRLFTDFGYDGDYAFDVGARIVLGPLSFNAPLYALTDEPWKFRWSLGFQSSL